MGFLPLREPVLRLALVFFALVLVPSFLLGYFSLRAVERERAAAVQRSLADQERYADFAARAVRVELEDLEAVWEALVPRAVGWDEYPEALRDALDGARGQAFVRSCNLLHVSGRQLYPVVDSLTGEPDPGVRQAMTNATMFQELITAAEAAEFDSGDWEAAMRAYGQLLAQADSPRLRAMAHAGIGRLQLRHGRVDDAIREYHQILTRYPDARDLNNQPLRLHAQLQVARGLEERGDSLGAARTLVTMYEDLVGLSDEMGKLQYDIMVERVEGRMAGLLPASRAGWSEVEQRYAAVRLRPKKSIGPDYFVHKLSRKLIRASLDGLTYTTPLRYLSDSVDGQPFLFVYLYLPDASGTRVAGLAGLEIDLPALSRALLPEILRRLELSGDVGLALVDESGRAVAGDAEAPRAAGATSNLGLPFDFWNVVVFRRQAAPSRFDFRSSVYLYIVLLSLLTILAGAVLVVTGLRRQTQLANLKTSFVSGISHELRTPLTAIRMYAELLEIGGEQLGAADRVRYAATLRRECDRLRRLIDSVLDFARSERGAKTYRFEYEDIGTLVRGIAEEFRAQAEAEGFRYEVSIEPDLPEMRVDAEAVRQMLLNLLSNAVKYSDTERAITVHGERRGDELALHVEDRGIGIEPHEQERIFNDFYQADTGLTSRRGGVGLGLTLVRQMAAAHGGGVRVESQPGRGSRFTVWLPLEPPQDSPSRQADARPSAGAVAKEGRDD